MTITISTARAELSKAIKENRQCKKEAAELRLTWLEQLAESRAEQMGGTMEQHILALCRRETARQEAQVCRSAVGRVRITQVLLVKVTDASGNWVESTTRGSIEQACLAENFTRLQQAASTPFLQPPLNALIDPLMTNHFAQSIRDSEFNCPPQTDPATARVIEALARSPETAQQPMPTTIDPEEY